MRFVWICFERGCSRGGDLNATRALTFHSAAHPRRYWFAIAWTALALALPPLTHCGKHFKAVRGAAWALLTSASIFNAIICNATLARALDGEESTTAPAVATAGFALLVASSCGIIGAGSAVEHGQRRAALGGIGAESKLWRAATLVPRTLGRAATGLFEVRQRARAAAAGALALMAAGWAIALGGSAAVQAECSRDPAAMRAFRLAYYPYQDAGDNTVDCARAFAELWWAWALATATLFVAAGVAAARQMARFRAAGFALLISCGTFNFLVITALLHWYHDTTGAFRAASCAALSGFIVFDVGAFALIFAGAAYAHAAQRAGLDSVRAAPHAARRARAARAAFAALQAVAWAALAAALVALALAQSDLTAGEAAPPTVVFYLRFDWFIWAVAVAGLALGGGTVHVAALARFKAAAWLLLVYAANLSMLVCTRTYKVGSAASLSRQSKQNTF